MTNRSRLTEVTGLEEDEEFEIKGCNQTYRFHNGRRQFKFEEEWLWCDSEETLINIINDPSLIQRKPRFNDEEKTFLRLLRKYGKVYKIEKTKNFSAYLYMSNYVALADNICALLKPGEIIDLDEMFKEDVDND